MFRICARRGGQIGWVKISYQQLPRPLHLLLQINEKAVKKTGEVNAGFTDEKNTSEVKSGDATGQEPWMNNYVPYGKNPSGNPIDQVLLSSNIFNTLNISIF